MTDRRLRSMQLTALLLALALLGPGLAAAKKGDKKDAAPDGATKDEVSWDVMAPPGPTRQVQLDVEEGTWLNLDVSPDGEEIVFDLLGDLYAGPFAGGEARALTTGIAWDMQPRYSPDGRHISFTSDRAGGDNIWIMDRDGSHPVQVTKEDFRLVNNAVWSPDGDYLAVRKHFTSRRSLGAGEIWLYHRSGGGGLQLNERPNDQKDLGEPAFSPDGRYVYFSRDSTPGGFFEYNKDSNGQIYTIHRLDRLNGQIDTLIDGPGGAVRPTPSPDGKSLAFVRRVRYHTTLWVRDLETGADRMVHDGLERDMQETWAVHGVYPNMAWTPDSQWIVFWAGGKLHRVDAASGEVAEIPFHVRSTRTIQEAVRPDVEIAAEHFNAKMIRWPQVSPLGDKTVFQALGYLWVMASPNYEPRRLTDQTDHFELYPSFTRDGQWIVYTTWNDEDLGTVRVVPAEGGESRVVVSRPGHYLEPVASPDNTLIVYREERGGFVTSPLYGDAPGLYRVPFKGGVGVRIREDGEQPQFAVQSNRLFFMTHEPEDRRALRSIGLVGKVDDGFDPIDRSELVHYTSEAATDFQVSPDGKWLAFSERYNVYVTPFIFASKAIDLGPKTSSVPLRQVSRDAGEHLHWSSDSSKLHWSLGPELYERRLEDAFAFLDGAAEELPEPVAEGRVIELTADVDRPDGRIALVGATVITMRGDEVLEDAVVLVDGDHIVAVGPRAEVEVPEGAHVVDVSGHVVMPGLVDVHWHGSQGAGEIIPQQNWFNYAALAFGVTTIHDPSNSTSTFFAAAEMARAGEIVAPRLYSTGRILYGAAGDFKAIIDEYDDALAHLRRMKKVGAFSVKSYNQPRRDQRQQVIQAARELGMRVMPEGGSLFMHNMTQVVDGHTTIEHNIPVAAIYDDVEQLWAAADTAYVPTLVVSYGGISGERYWYQHTNVWENERLMSFVPYQQIDPVARRRTMAPEEEYNHFREAEVAKALTDVGVKVGLGAHGQREGLAAHWEMWMFVQGGMTPMEALRAGTRNGAWILGMDDQIGSLEPGKFADLIVLEKNPLEDIRNSESVVYTMVNGRLYDARTMHEIGNHPSMRKHFFFARDNKMAAEVGGR